MSKTDLSMAAGIAVFTLVATMAASYPMVAFYATYIEPGQSVEFYRDAAMRIAPWSSYVLGPLSFFFCTYWAVKKRRIRDSQAFAATAIGFYVLLDLVILSVILRVPLSANLSGSLLISVLVKLFAAMLGASRGMRSVE